MWDDSALCYSSDRVIKQNEAAITNKNSQNDVQLPDPFKTTLWKPLMDIVFNVLDTKKDVICINMDSIPENKIFSYINSYLYMLSKEEINWNIKDNE